MLPLHTSSTLLPYTTLFRSRERISTSVEVPLTSESKKVLNLAGEEADRLRHRHVGTEHLLFGLLRLERSFVSEILKARGLDPAMLREQMAKILGAERTNVQPKSNTRAIATLDTFLAGLKWHKAKELLTFFAEDAQFVRSEEHTSELQSLTNIV